MRKSIATFIKCAAFGAALVAAGASAAADGAALETVVKATYLYKFEAYVEWPASSFASPSAPFILCILGDDAFAEAVDHAVSGQRIGPRSFEVRRLATASGETGCHILYVSRNGTQPVAQALATVRGMPVLTVTDRSSGGRETGIIDFVVEDNRIRFAINSAAASVNGVTISSELLKLASSVKP